LARRSRAGAPAAEGGNSFPVDTRVLTRRLVAHCRRKEHLNRRTESKRQGQLRRRESRALGFRCRNCSWWVSLDKAGSAHRNHCPRCLHSVHLDTKPGDRAASCDGLMEPVAVWIRGGGEWAVIHRCMTCGCLSSNRIAGDDNEALLLSVAARPIARPPFPLDR
jgi:hypothetical protein